jgi:C-3',4' desaturase CrtD
MNKTIIVGAGIGGLVTATELTRRGQDVTVLEAHVEPGGCAATFFHQGYRFDAGATLAGGFAPGAPLDLLGQRFQIDWQTQATEIAMQVHLPDGTIVNRWSDPERWRTERLNIFGRIAEPFWQWQESTADQLWQLAYRLPPWPPQSASDLFTLGETAFHWLAQQPVRDSATLARAAFEPAQIFLPPHNLLLRQFVDAQLLISAQVTSQKANALYSSAALDLARQGVASLPGGMGSIAKKLATALQNYGGQIRYRQTVTQVKPLPGGLFEIVTQRGETYHANTVIFNQPPWNIKTILGEAAPQRLRQLPEQPEDGWGAFMIYAGLPNDLVPHDLPLHQQVIQREPLGEGNSIFLSLSPAWDASRAPEGHRAVTISSHTQLAPWWQLNAQDPAAYEARKNAYTEGILATSERILPGITAHAELILPGTPVTFHRFTRRAWGWVGGFPQTNLFRAWGPKLTRNLWMVGDSIFPGQSVPAAALGGLRVAGAVLASQRKLRSYHLLHFKKLRRLENLP